jgi:arabinofuranosyltransferase
MKKEGRAEGEPSKEVLHWLGPVLLMLSVGLLAEAAYSWWPRTVDDAFVTFRYAQNLTDGLGPVYNLGERVEGYSSPIWMLGSAAAIGVGVDPLVASKWAGLISGGALSVAVYLALRAFDVRAWGAGLATCAVGGSFVLQLWSTSGMETAAYAALFFVGLAIISCIGGSVRGALLASAFLAAASLTRPEGTMFWVLGGALYLVDVRKHPQRLSAYVWPGVTIALLFAWRLAYYGSLFPNTYYAKTGGGPDMLRKGLAGLTNFVSEPTIAILMLAALLGLVAGLARRETRRAAMIMAGATLVHLAWVVSVGDDGLAKYRFYVPIVGPTAFLVGLLFYDPGIVQVGLATRRHHALAALGTLAIFIAVPLSVSHFHSAVVPRLNGTMGEYLEGNVKLGRHLAATRTKDTVIAVASAGAIPFYSRLPTIDMYGLNDAHIARVPFPESPGRMMKWDNAHVLSRSPDLIVINRGYRRAGQKQGLSVAPMDRDLINRLRSDSRYAWSSIQFDDGSSFFVYERVSSAGQ